MILVQLETLEAGGAGDELMAELALVLLIILVHLLVSGLRVV